jgi:uncharacterized alkaline shock family protein YloU
MRFNKAASGSVSISDDVIASIAMSAAKEVEGFGSFSPRIPDMLTQILPESIAPSRKSVKVYNVDGEIRIQLFINVKDGSDVNKVSADIMSAVKNSVQNMTDKAVSKVNVCVQGIDFCEPNELNENS